MQLTDIGLRRRAWSYTPYAILSTAPDIGQPYPPGVHNIPPPPDVLIPEDGDDGELDLPIEDEPDTGISRSDRPEKQPGGGMPRDHEIKRRTNAADDEDPPPPTEGQPFPFGQCGFTRAP